jgi:hypothetical protein
VRRKKGARRGERKKKIERERERENGEDSREREKRGVTEKCVAKLSKILPTLLFINRKIYRFLGIAPKKTKFVHEERRGNRERREERERERERERNMREREKRGVMEICVAKIGKILSTLLLSTKNLSLGWNRCQKITHQVVYEEKGKKKKREEKERDRREREKRGVTEI